MSQDELLELAGGYRAEDDVVGRVVQKLEDQEPRLGRVIADKVPRQKSKPVGCE